MKTLLFFITIIAFSTPATSQSIDSLERVILNMKATQTDRMVIMRRFEKAHGHGQIIVVAGAITSVMSALIQHRQQNDDSFAQPGARPVQVGFYVGAGMIATGTVMQIVSHKWIKKMKRRI
jgi:hypothetical protein